MELLSPADSLQLFRDRVGLTSAGADGLAELEQDIVRVCNGLPLALRIAGGQLWKESAPAVWQVRRSVIKTPWALWLSFEGVRAPERVTWQSKVRDQSRFLAGPWPPRPPQAVLESLKAGAQLSNATTDDQLRGVLTTSFNSLSSSGQNMFLDVAVVLHGFHIDTALRVWRAWWGLQADDSLKELKRRSLVSVDEDGRVMAHDITRSAGYAILRDPKHTTPHGLFYGSRLWVLDDGQLLDCSQARGSQTILWVNCRGAMLQGAMRMPLVLLRPSFLHYPAPLQVACRPLVVLSLKGLVATPPGLAGMGLSHLRILANGSYQASCIALKCSQLIAGASV